MVFSSPIFLFAFLPLTLLAYLAAPSTARTVPLLLASLLFYAWGEPWFSLIMLGSIGINYVHGLLVDRGRGTGAARIAVVMAVVANIGLLAVFKYADFAVENLNLLLAAAGWPPLRAPSIELPIGISFFTFQALSYVIDVHRGEAPLQRDPLRLGLYISMFPQLIAGPIVRYRDIAEQIARPRVTLERFASGVQRFVIGLGKKVLVANTLAVPADAIFAIPGPALTAPVAWFGVICYTLQIYFDFSGYSDMAIGLGRMLGFEFKENFDYPYTSRTVTEFWRRWHISLSSWFRDYVYIPLGGSRGPAWQTYRNLWVVFLLCGLWHGASWSFAAWGLFHGSFLVMERAGLGGLLLRLGGAGHVYTLLVVMVGWVLFRAPTIDAAGRFLAAMAGFGQGTGIEYHLDLYLDAERAAVILAAAVGSSPVWRAVGRLRERAAAPALGVALDLGLAVGALAVLLASATMLAAGTHNPFIYFRF
jgi:alginate O-acetyltransferase complex protein AlgI